MADVVCVTRPDAAIACRPRPTGTAQRPASGRPSTGPPSKGGQSSGQRSDTKRRSSPVAGLNRPHTSGSPGWHSTVDLSTSWPGAKPGRWAALALVTTQYGSPALSEPMPIQHPAMNAATAATPMSLPLLDADAIV
jgi:hypothetical protein